MLPNSTERHSNKIKKFYWIFIVRWRKWKNAVASEVTRSSQDCIELLNFEGNLKFQKNFQENSKLHFKKIKNSNRHCYRHQMIPVLVSSFSRKLQSPPNDIYMLDNFHINFLPRRLAPTAVSHAKALSLRLSKVFINHRLFRRKIFILREAFCPTSVVALHNLFSAFPTCEHQKHNCRLS